MWIPQEPILNLFIRSVVVYFVLLIGIRISGKRDVGNMTPFDMVLLLLIANGVQNAMTGNDYTLSGGLLVGVFLLIINFIVSRLSWRFKAVRKVIEGVPTPLVYDGKVIVKNMQIEKITDDELSQALREHDAARVDDVKLAMLEIDGSISVIKK
ncbi:DUF421 domain-containing protein [bacterium]|nr:DUF421 domain-containing protein [bacterium]